MSITRSIALIISTGAAALDKLLGGGVRSGLLLDIFGESGSGKSQACFTLSANCVLGGGNVLFIDTWGTFRPERMIEIAGTDKVLNAVTYHRAFSVQDQLKAVERIAEIDPELVVIDSVTSLFSTQYSGPERHLRLMGHLHDLALEAITSSRSIVITNMVRAVLSEDNEMPGPSTAPAENHASVSQVREFLGSTMSLCSHYRLQLGIVDSSNGLFLARLHQPGSGTAEFSIGRAGLIDVQRY